ncbi:hypothetical protein ACW7GX_01390 [Aeromonas hydrophila]
MQADLLQSGGTVNYCAGQSTDNLFAGRFSGYGTLLGMHAAR